MNKFNSVLLVDDDSINNFLNKRLIKKLDLADHVEVKLNGLEGINYLKEACVDSIENCPSIIFLDINMPVMDGFDFIKAYQNSPFPKKGIIAVLTTSRSDQDIQTLRNLGDFYFLNKPLTEEKLKNFFERIE